MPEVKEIDYGIASRVGNFIYMHRNLKEFPELYNAILKHELEHTPDYSFKDIFLDINNKNLKGHKKDYWKFMLKNPSAWFQLSPILVYDKKTTFDLTLIIFYGLVLIIVGVIGWLL